MALQFRRGDQADIDPTKLAAGEPAACLDKHKLFIGMGNGATFQAGDMFKDDFANGSGAMSTKPVDLALFAKHAVGFIGEIKPFAGAMAPNGTLLCNGAAVSRATYADLFAAIGTTWGTGDGNTTFNLPNLCGRTLIGAGTAASGTTYTLGQTGGEEKHTLTKAELPALNLTLNAQITGAGTGGNIIVPLASGGAAGGLINDGCGGGAHNNLQPYAVVNYVIVY